MLAVLPLAGLILWGRVVVELDEQDTYTNLRLAVDRVNVEVEEHQVKGIIPVRAKHYPAREYGDKLEAEGKLETPSVFADFSYRDYLARWGIHGMLGWPEITLLSQGGDSSLYRALLFVKAEIQATIVRILPEPEVSLLAGMLQGVEAGIPEGVREASSTSGTMHVMAISGLNYTQTI